MTTRIGAVTAALAVASIAATLLALAARAWWVAELATHFRVQLVAGQVLLLGVLGVLGRCRLALIVVLAAAVNGWYLYPVLWPSARAAAASAGEPLAVMTVNVSKRNDSPPALIAMIERERPDVVLVLELTPRFARALERLGPDYAHRKLVPQEEAFGLGLVSRYPLLSVEQLDLGASPALDARVAGPAGSFRMLGVHLMPPMSPQLAAERNRQLEQLAERRATIDEPLVVLGDFNVSPYSPYYVDWVAGTGLEDTLAGRGPSATWPTFFPVLGIPIDHCFVSAEFTVIERRHLSDLGSDHYPVLVNLLQEAPR